MLALLTAGCSLIDLMSGKTPPILVHLGLNWTAEDADIIDPYAVPGFWAKAQLHLHTNRSSDGKWSVEKALETYAARGYDFVAITDHDTVTVSKSVPDGLTVITGEEHTLAHLSYPIGQHVIFLFIDRHATGGSFDRKSRDVASQGGLSMVAHPSWNGFGGYGKWHQWHLDAVPSFQMMEVYNPHSDPDLDTALWHETVLRRGPNYPVWAVAVDDAHDASGADRGWIMVKVEGRGPDHLRSALIRGSFYATTGIVADFGVDSDGVIWAQSSEPAEIVFINAASEIVLKKRNVGRGEYRPVGTEGFIRIEIAGCGAANERGHNLFGSSKIRSNITWWLGGPYGCNAPCRAPAPSRHKGSNPGARIRPPGQLGHQRGTQTGRETPRSP